MRFPSAVVTALANTTQALYSVPAQTPGRTGVHLRVVPDSGESNSPIVTLLLETLASLGKSPQTVEEAQKWSDELTQKLRQNGFPLGQAMMTQEDWQNAQTYGQFVFTVFPGHIAKITVKNTSRVSDAKLLKIITRALCGANSLADAQRCLLNTRNLERSTQLLQDVPGVAMGGAPRFAAGEVVGETEVEFDIAAKGKPVQVSVIADNSGVAATGRLRVGASLTGNNLFHVGDAYGLTAMYTKNGMWTGSASASAPLGNSGLRASGQITRQQFSINSVTPITGVSTVVQGGVQYPFARGLDSNVWGGLWLVHNRSGSELTDYAQSTHSTINSVQLSLQADNGDRAKQLRTNRWGVSAAVTAGHDSTTDPSDPVTRRGGNYAKATAQASGSLDLTKTGNLFMTGQINSQVSSRNLDSSEQLALGGPGAVRGYRGDEGSADEGAVMNMGVYQRFQMTTGHQLQLGGFFDVGYGRVNHSPWDGWSASYVGVGGVKNIRELAGYGISADWLMPIGATLSVAVARPFGFSPASWVDPGQKPTQYWMTLGVSH